MPNNHLLTKAMEALKQTKERKIADSYRETIENIDLMAAKEEHKTACESDATAQEANSARSPRKAKTNRVASCRAFRKPYGHY